MTGPDTLYEHGNNVDYPTWQWPVTTKLYVRSLTPDNWAMVTVHAGDASEDVAVDGGATNVIERSWAGIFINVANSRDDMNIPVEVWTE